MHPASAWLTVKGLRVVIDQPNALGVPIDTQVVVSYATSNLTGPIVGLLSGYAFGTSAKVGAVVASGPSFTRYLPCMGTGGAVLTNTGSGPRLTGTVSADTVTNTSTGTVSGTSAAGTTTSTVQTASMVNGLVRATGVKGVANVSSNGTTTTLSDSGSRFATLSVAGHPEINANVAPNTRVAIAGVGTLYLRRVFKVGKAVEVRMIELHVTSNVRGGPAIGTVIKVADAGASISQ